MQRRKNIITPVRRTPKIMKTIPSIIFYTRKTSTAFLPCDGESHIRETWQKPVKIERGKLPPVSDFCPFVAFVNTIWRY